MFLPDKHTEKSNLAKNYQEKKLGIAFYNSSFEYSKFTFFIENTKYISSHAWKILEFSHVTHS